MPTQVLIINGGTMKKKKILIIALVLLLIAGGSAGGYYYFTNIHNSSNTSNQDGNSNNSANSDANNSNQITNNYDYSSINDYSPKPNDLSPATTLTGYNFYDEDLDAPSADKDGDGLTNNEEESLGTDPELIDTDNDGISDYDEVNVTNTDPLNPDSDGDGLLDGIELLAGLDPLNAMSDGVTADNKVKVSNHISYDSDCNFMIKGLATVYSTYFEELTLTGFSSTPGVVSPLYEFYIDSNFDNAVIEIAYDEETLMEMNYSVDDLAICSFDARENTFTKLANQSINETTHTVRANVTSSGKYVLCNYDVVDTNSVPEILFLIDNSGSMYSKELVEGSIESDLDFKRLDMAKDLINMCGNDATYGISKFTDAPTNLAPIGSDNDTLLTALESIRTDEEDFDGTGIANTICDSIDLFDYSANSRKFIVMLTDGEEALGGLFSFATQRSPYDAIDTANAYDVTVIMIGLGNGVDTNYLSNIANNTNGRYVYANNADALDIVYETIFSAINYDVELSDDEDGFDAFVIADSGFDANVHGFSFDNYGIFTNTNDYSDGQCFGMALFAQKYYTGNLSMLGNETSYKHRNGNLCAESYNLNNVPYFAKDIMALSYANLYGYTNSTITAFNELRSIELKDRYTLNDDGRLVYTDAALSLIENNKFFKISVVECDDEQTFVDGSTYTSYEYACFNLEGIDKNTLTDEDLETYELFTALSNLFTLQLSDECANNSQSFPGVGFDDDKQITQFLRISQNMKSGMPYVMSISNIKSGHTILATKIVRSIDDPTDYRIIVYDNNYAGEEHYLSLKLNTVTKFEFNYTKWKNTVYYDLYDVEQLNFTSNPNKAIRAMMYLPE